MIQLQTKIEIQKYRRGFLWIQKKTTTHQVDYFMSFLCQLVARIFGDSYLMVAIFDYLKLQPQESIYVNVGISFYYVSVAVKFQVKIILC